MVPRAEPAPTLTLEEYVRRKAVLEKVIADLQARVDEVHATVQRRYAEAQATRDRP